MHLSEEQLNEIQSMASLFFTPEEIAVNIEVDPSDFLLSIKSQYGQAYKRFMAGRFSAEVELRKAVQQAALNGSSPAQQIMINWQNRLSNE